LKTLGEFDYVRPESVAEVGSFLKAHQDVTRLIAGGTDLITLMKDRVLVPKYVLDVKSLPGLDTVRWSKREGLTMGTLTTITTLLETEVIRDKYVSLYESAASFGTTQVRNMATVGGNICRSSPAADIVPPLLVFDSTVKLVGPGAERTVPLGEFFTGPGRNVLKNEMLTEIHIPPHKEPYGTAFRKMGRTSEDLAQVNCAVKVVVADGTFEDVKIALGAVAPTPVRARTVEQALIGQETSAELIKEAANKATKDISPISDNRASAEYRKHVTPILVRRLITEAITRIGS
jgi:carbon-monoxide dehydrogenase medium subunit